MRGDETLFIPDAPIKGQGIRAEAPPFCFLIFLPLPNRSVRDMEHREGAPSLPDNPSGVGYSCTPLEELKPDAYLEKERVLREGERKGRASLLRRPGANDH